jgi:hypothetical protein
MARNYVNFLIAVAVSALLKYHQVSAYSTGAGGCAGGMAAVGGSHLDASNGRVVVPGTLTDGAISVTIDGVTLDVNGVNEFAAGRDLPVSVVAGDVSYLGVLARFEAPGADPANLSLTPGADLQVATVCATPVLGITHTNNNMKMSTGGTLRVDESVDAATLDVTAVFINTAEGSAFVYSGFKLAFRLQNTTGAPTQVPVGGSPTEAPIAGALPTESPVAGVTQAPVPALGAPTGPPLITTSAPMASQGNPTPFPVLSPVAGPATEQPASLLGTEQPTQLLDTVGTEQPTYVGVDTTLPTQSDTYYPEKIKGRHHGMMMGMGMKKGKAMMMKQSKKKKKKSKSSYTDDDYYGQYSNSDSSTEYGSWHDFDDRRKQDQPPSQNVFAQHAQNQYYGSDDSTTTKTTRGFQDRRKKGTRV